MTRETVYWDALAAEWQSVQRQALWRAHCDQVGSALLERWLPTTGVDSLLKTDLFDEACRAGLYPLLARRATRVVGVDISATVLRGARARHPGLCGMVADVRCLPFGNGAFDIVVSTSTLDHFASPRDLVAGLRELERVLRPGGLLLLTLDNAANPAVALRNALPFRPLSRLGVLPYYVGATWGPRRLRSALDRLGFRVIEEAAIMHSPRVVSVAVANLLERHGGPRAQRRFLRGLLAFERLARLPTRYLTGYLVAVLAVKGGT
jgi:SAM-dependent methyltransferase